MKDVVAILEERGLVENVTSPNVREILKSPVSVYAGFDPTSSSLQVGNLVAVMGLAHFQRCGHKVAALVGGATGRIGDPSGKQEERPLLSEDQIRANVAGITSDLSKILDTSDGAVSIVDNQLWLGDLKMVDFLRDVAKHFRVGAMLGKESVRSRLASESGMSFAEFSYQLLQAYDFLKLYDLEQCVLQIGGSDQWGNITAGIDLIRRLRGAETYGVTLPLVCDSAGQKFGKSEGNAVYLNSRLTSCYDFYQFFLRTTDQDVVRMLKIFTFLTLEEIEELGEELEKAPEKRIAQKKLAEEVTRIVHGSDGLRVARRASDVLFGGSIEGLRSDELLEIFSDVSSVELTRQEVVGAPVVDVAAASGLCSSKGEARRLLQSGGLYVNNCRVEQLDDTVADSAVVDGRILVLRSGKKTFTLVKVI